MDRELPLSLGPRNGGSGEGGWEHVSERTLRCVSERAETATHAWTLKNCH
jgi:hypothetical protein